MSGIDVLRGDELTVSFAPFLDKAFSWVHFVKKNKVWIDKIVNVYETVKPALFAVILAVVLYFVFLLSKKLYAIFLKKRALKHAQLTADLEEQAQKEAKMSELEEMKQAILQLAQTKPDQFNMVLNSWMDLDKKEGS